MSRYHYTVSEQFEGMRLDLYIAEVMTDLPSRSFLKKLINSKKVLVNNECVKASYHVELGDQVTVDFSTDDLPKQRVDPEDKPLDIFYEDAVLAVIAKPIDLTVHPLPGHTQGTLVNILLHHFKSLSDINGDFRPGIVHRLDKETSGLMVIAKNNQAHQRLVWQFQKHQVQKQYIALVQGHIEYQEGEIEAPIGQSRKFHDHRVVNFEDEQAKNAHTIYKVVRRLDSATLVRLFPTTGRTHQLRLHMKHLGHPILGDAKYGSKQRFDRLALHAQGLSFVHPIVRERMAFVTKMPAMFASLVAH